MTEAASALDAHKRKWNISQRNGPRTLKNWKGRELQKEQWFINATRQHTSGRMGPVCGRSLSVSKSLRTICEGVEWNHLYSNPLPGNPWNCTPHQTESQTVFYGMDSHGICCSNRGSPSSKTAMFHPATLALKAPWSHRQQYWWSSSPIPSASCGTSQISKSLLHDHCRHDQMEFPIRAMAQWKPSTPPWYWARQEKQIRAPQMAHRIPSPLCQPNIDGKCLDKDCALLHALAVEWKPCQNDQTSQAMGHRLCTPSMPHSIAVLWSRCHGWTKFWTPLPGSPASWRTTQGCLDTNWLAWLRTGSEKGTCFPACSVWAYQMYHRHVTPFPTRHGCLGSWSASSCVHVLHLHARQLGSPSHMGCLYGKLHGLDGSTCNAPRKQKGSAAYLRGSQFQSSAASHRAQPSKWANPKNGHKENVVWWAGPPWRFSPAVTVQISWTLHAPLFRFFFKLTAAKAFSPLLLCLVTRACLMASRQETLAQVEKV